MQHRLHPDDTIAALASAPGPANRGIVRISGRETGQLLADWFRANPLSPAADLPGAAPPGPRGRVPWRTEGTVTIAGFWSPCPVALHSWPGPRSYTGECLAELHTEGSPPLLEALLGEVFRRGARPAEPGEFTLRAFLAGRIDLMQAEAVLGVIDAQGDDELRTALGQLAGGLSVGLAALRSDLLDLLADLEAGLDFADEPIEFVAHNELARRLHLAVRTLAPLRRQLGERSRSDARWRVVLTGPPNAGKSTLFNALVGRFAAVVSAEPGTTRDFLAAELDLDGVPIVLVDTAGAESPRDAIEQAAQAQRAGQLSQADLIIDCAPWGAADDLIAPADTNAMRIVTKSDLASSADRERAGSRLPVSIHDAASLRRLRTAVASRLTGSGGQRRQFVGSTAIRVRESLELADASLQRAVALAEAERDEDLLALELRDALQELGRITGAVYTDDILDRIFSRFCIGK
jgi:tRNA modification GTPase